MIYLVSYASDNMTISQEHLVVSALSNGVDHTFSYARKDIDPLFYGMNQKTLEAGRGAGFWLWKPYVINKAIHSGYLNEGDILIYGDAGVKFIAPVRHLINALDQDILLFSNGWKQAEWCKGNVLRGILGIDWREHAEKPQVQASVIVMKITDFTKKFMAEWLTWCQLPGFIDDSPSDFNYETFADHRHDQAILCCLQIKYGLKLHWWPTQYSMHLQRTDSYPPLFDHHRLRNHEWKGVCA